MRRLRSNTTRLKAKPADIGFRGSHQAIYEVEALERRTLLSATMSTLANLNNQYSMFGGGLVADSAGNLYGSTTDTVFELSGPGHQTLTALFNFNSNTGYPRIGLAIDGFGNLYGVTGEDSVFELSGPNHQTFSTLATLTTSEGSNIVSTLLVTSSGDIYGTAQGGGAYGYGTVFEVAAGSHAISTLVSFNRTDGSDPSSSLIADANGNLYGTTLGGGANDEGTVFELSGSNHQTLTTLALFGSLVSSSQFDGSSSVSLILNGNIYGTTGGSGWGTIFELSGPNHSTVTILYDFQANEVVFSPTSGLLADSLGNLYGMTAASSFGNGSIFELLGPNYQALTVLAIINTSDGAYPQAGLLADSSGNLYGVTGEGNNGEGTVFELSGAMLPSLPVNANTSDTGGTIRIVGGTNNLSGVSDFANTIVVSPGANLSGMVELELDDLGPSSDVTPFIYTPSWGNPQTSWRLVSSSIQQGLSAFKVTEHLAAPTTPGVYHINFAFEWEEGGDNVASGTNWATGKDVWGDGNDIATLNQSQIQEGQQFGYTEDNWLLPTGYAHQYVPFDSITIVVSGNTSLAAPSNFQATQGTLANEVGLSWNAVSGATAYQIWRNTTSASISATEIASDITNTMFDDTTAAPGVNYNYWVVSANPSDTSALSSPASGFAGEITATTVPVVAVTTPAGIQQGNVSISYNLMDADSDECNIVAQYSVDGGATWLIATPGVGGDGNSSLRSSPDGNAHTFIWASNADVGVALNLGIEFRIIPNSAKGIGTPSDTGGFTLDNDTATSISSTLLSSLENWLENPNIYSLLSTDGTLLQALVPTPGAFLNLSLGASVGPQVDAGIVGAGAEVGGNFNATILRNPDDSITFSLGGSATATLDVVGGQLSADASEPLFAATLSSNLSIVTLRYQAFTGALGIIGSIFPGVGEILSGGEIDIGGFLGSLAFHVGTNYSASYFSGYGISMPVSELSQLTASETIALSNPLTAQTVANSNPAMTLTQIPLEIEVDGSDYVGSEIDFGTGLSVGSAYQYGMQETLLVLNGSPPSNPGTPLVTNTTTTGATVTWAPSTAPDGEIVSYTLGYQPSNDLLKFLQWQSVTTADTSYSLNGLSPGTQYDIQVQATYIGGRSAWVYVSHAFTTETAVPTAPGMPVPSNITATGVTISWTPSTAPDGQQIDYTIQYQPSADWIKFLNWQTVVTTDSSYVLSGLVPDTQYDMQIQASDGAGKSDWVSVNGLFTTSDSTYDAQNASSTTTTGSETSSTTPAASAPAYQFLIVMQSPNGSIAGGTINPSAVVAIEDQNGNFVTSDNSEVTLTLTDDFGNLITVLTSQAQNGIATFGSISLNAAGLYNLRATDGSDISGASIFVVSAGPSAGLTFVQQPTNITAGEPLASVSVQAADQYSNPIVGDLITLSVMTSGSTGPYLTLTATSNASGVATFNNLSILTAGTYTLVANDTNGAAGTSIPFTVIPAPTYSVVFAQQPTDAVVGASLSPNPVVYVEDQYGNLISTDNSNVTLSVNTGPGSLSGTLTVQAQNGIATFTNLSFPAAGTYTLGASDGSLGSATSAAFTVLAATPAVSLVLPPPTITYDGTTDVDSWAIGVLTGARGANTPTGLPTVIFYNGTSATGTPLSSPPVNAGTYTAVATYAGDANYNPAQSNPVTFSIVGVANEYLFYYGSSAFNGSATSPSSADQYAIATDKSALVSGVTPTTATFANISNYTDGINGILIDFAGLPAGVNFSASDFQFRVGNTSNSSSWSTGPAPASVATWTGTNGDTFADIVWANNAIQNEWLQVTVLADANTHLASPLVFYFGNEIAATGATLNNGELQVNTTDVSLTQQNETGFASAPVNDVYDYNRDGSVNTTDVSIAQQNETGFGGLLLISVGGASGNVVLGASKSAAGSVAAVSSPSTPATPNSTAGDSPTSALLKHKTDVLGRTGKHHG